MGNYVSNIKAIYNELYEIKKKEHTFIVLRIVVLINLLKTISEYYNYHTNKYNIYNYNNRKYRIVFNQHKLHIDKLIKATDKNTNMDITDFIKEIAGPFEDFHNMDLTPKMLGYNQIEFSILNIDDIDMSNITFIDNDILKI